MRYRLLRYGLFAIGLLLAGVSFLVYLGNGLAQEGASGSVARLGILGMMAGSSIAGLGVVIGALLSRRFVPLAVVLVGGLASAAGGWVLGSLLFAGGRFHLEWWLAVCLAPVGMWLGWLGGASRSRVALGGTLGAVLGALAFPILFNVGGPPVNNEFWALAGLLSGGFLGILLGAFLGRSRSGQLR